VYVYNIVFQQFTGQFAIRTPTNFRKASVGPIGLKFWIGVYWNESVKLLTMSAYSSTTAKIAFVHKSADWNTDARARPSRNALGYK